MRIWLGRFAFVFGVMVSSASLAGDPACIARWEQAEKGGVILGFGMVDGTPTVRVDEDVWNQIDYTVKLGMAATFECAVVDPGESLTKANFVSHRTNKVLGEWRYGKLEVK